MIKNKDCKCLNTTAYEGLFWINLHRWALDKISKNRELFACGQRDVPAVLQTFSRKTDWIKYFDKDLRYKN